MTDAHAADAASLSLFLSGDVMTGRGIDRILPHPVDPRLYEPYVQSAEQYVDLAEEVSGPIPRKVDWDYIWGDSLTILRRQAPDLRIINLETAVTTHDEPQPKGINYRMSPANLGCLTAAGIDACVLANNHVLDWRVAGLEQTLESLAGAGLAVAGAGLDQAAAEAPLALPVPGGRVLLYAFGHRSSGVPESWAAGSGRPGVAWLPELSAAAADDLAKRVQAQRRPGDRVVVSVHWGGNWGYGVPVEQQSFARQLIEAGGADLVHGHSSHHPKAMEVHRGRLILYGCGDLLNDYEGIGGHQDMRPELALMYFPRLDAEGRLLSLEMAPMRIRRFRLNHPSAEEAAWLRKMLTREGRRFGTRVEETPTGVLSLRWDRVSR